MHGVCKSPVKSPNIATCKKNVLRLVGRRHRGVHLLLGRGRHQVLDLQPAGGERGAVAEL